MGDAGTQDSELVVRRPDEVDGAGETALLIGRWTTSPRVCVATVVCPVCTSSYSRNQTQHDLKESL